MKQLLKFAQWPALLVGIILLLGACHRAPSRTANSPKHMRGVWLTDVGTMALTYTTLLVDILPPVNERDS